MPRMPLEGSHDHQQDGDSDVVLALSRMRRGLEPGAAGRGRRVLAETPVAKTAASAGARGQCRCTGVECSLLEVVRRDTMQPKRKDSAPSVHDCPVCHRPQTKIQRRVGSATGGSTIYVCARAGECIVGVNLSKIDNWVAV